jgi:hypothetical protein
MSDDLKYELFEQELLAPSRGHVLSDDESLVAALLLDAASSRPIGIKHIVEVMNSRPRSTGRRKATDRVIKDIIRTLRKEHEFPILSRKFARPAERDKSGHLIAEAKPAGYWWCASETEMEEFVVTFSKQPMDELHTLSRIVKANFPKLAGQLQMDYSWCGNRDGERVDAETRGRGDAER